MRAKLRGFTLIELLIVVAIIAILAAIAVPNFLEARVRAMVARVKSDQRTYTTAIQAYAVDWNEYPVWMKSSKRGPVTKPKPGNISIDLSSLLKPFEETLIPLSTPVAYITDAFIAEPFNNKQGQILFRGGKTPDETGGVRRLPLDGEVFPIYLYVGLPGESFDSTLMLILENLLPAGGHPGTPEEIKADAESILRKRFFIISPGPDGLYSYDRCVLEQSGGGGSINETCLYAQVVDVSVERVGGIYDPTNGTVSRGELVRTQSGIMMDR